MSAANTPSKVSYLGPTHPLAEVAGRHCAAHTLGRSRFNYLGGVACGRCWERAIRDDERVVVEYDLPRELTPDPNYIDHIAVELACSGERTPLTDAERLVVVALLRDWGFTTTGIARRLHINVESVRTAEARHDQREAAA